MKKLSNYLVPVEEEALRPLLTELLQSLCQRYNLPLAILYLADSERGEQFRYEAGSGFTGKPTPEEFVAGAGLFGQAVVEKRLLSERIPVQALISPILSSLVELEVLFWYAIPLLYQEQVQGVLVLAASEDKTAQWQDPEWIDFIREWGAYLQSVRSRRYIQALLEKTQVQNQELATREEELRQNLEELSVTQEEMRRTQELLKERARWQELVIDLFALTAATTVFESGSAMRVFLAQASRFMEARGALALWRNPKDNTFEIVYQWHSRAISQVWPEEWRFQDSLIARLEGERKALSVVAHELLAEGVPGLTGWYVAPYYSVHGLSGLLLFGFPEVQPLSSEVENALRSMAIAFFSTLERLIKAYTKDFPDLIEKIAKIFGGLSLFLPAKSIKDGEIPWLEEIPLIQRDVYLSSLRTATEKGGLWEPPADIALQEIGFASHQGIWMLRVPPKK